MLAFVQSLQKKSEFVKGACIRLGHELNSFFFTAACEFQLLEKTGYSLVKIVAHYIK